MNETLYSPRCGGKFISAFCTIFHYYFRFAKQCKLYYTECMKSNKFTVLELEGACVMENKNLGIAPVEKMAYNEDREALLREAFDLILRLSPEQLAEIMGVFK